MKRVSFLIDGFNLYGSIVEVYKSYSICTKWLDVKSLLTSYFGLIGKDCQLEEIYYFTAIQDYLKDVNPDKIKKHLNYIKCLQSTGVIIRKGRFKEKCISYKNKVCEIYLKKHEEKETDVAIGIKLFELLHLNKCDICAIVTGDTDLIPAIEACQRCFPDIKVLFIIPYFRNHSSELKRVAPGSFKMNYSQYKNNQFSNSVTLKDGTILTKPQSW
jgi:uncharacterized LabA/DUF88 family protein